MNENVNDNLNVVFKEHYEYCINWLVSYLKCTKPDAEDCFMDALIKLREQIKSEKFKSTNVRAWLCTVSKNAYLNQKSGKNKVVSLTIEKAEAYLGQQKGIYSLNFNPMLKKEILEQLTLDEKKRIDVYKQAFFQLGDVCKKILNRLKEGAKLKNLTDELGYANYDTLKSTKARCIKNLKLNVNKLMK